MFFQNCNVRPSVICFAPIENDAHTIHGGPLKVDSKLDGYPHRNGGYLTPSSPSPEWTNALLNDRAFNGDPLKLRIYGNYPGSMRLPNYETHVFGDKAEKLSRICTEYDPLGGFDSPRYVQRNRRTVSSSTRPSNFVNAVSNTASVAFLIVFAVVALV
mmetsp:Transcript_50009/g.55777  ORF Transcript_50009/g.55777 Transcript_50009/m.55777 type:complete len:158 (-) Transcript_50009:1065-1538(-)